MTPTITKPQAKIAADMLTFQQAMILNEFDGGRHYVHDFEEVDEDLEHLVQLGFLSRKREGDDESYFITPIGSKVSRETDIGKEGSR